jgi:hypothetical protein
MIAPALRTPYQHPRAGPQGVTWPACGLLRLLYDCAHNEAGCAAPARLLLYG